VSRAVHPFGEAAFLVETDDAASAEGLRRSLAAGSIPGLEALVPGRRSLLVEFDPLVADAHELYRSLVDGPVSALPDPGHARVRRIPVIYGGEHGPDLDEIASLAGMRSSEVVELHTATELRVLFCGFAPGFAYLGDVAPALAVPRLATPRARTPAGSVALADGMTGIYPSELPGGWRVIGRTPRVLFDAHRTPPAYLVPGDVVRFEPIRPEDAEAQPGPAPDW
jgi:5-oxoprolinase (ATP-hydrolysing) subunit B